MSAISSITSGASSAAAATSSSTKDQPHDLKDLDINQFLKLMVSELTNQDPLNPMSGSEFVAQLAQLSTLNGVEVRSRVREVRPRAQVLDERAGVVAATVTTARPIADAAHEQLRGTLAALTGKQVRIDFITDAELIGGVVTRIGSTVYDGSVRNQLQQVKEKMIG